MSGQAHCILLIQLTQDIQTRTFSDYESVQECIQGVATIFEEILKNQNPTKPNITYGIGELLVFVDTLADLSCLVYNRAMNMYRPLNKDWIKQKLVISLRKEAQIEEDVIHD